RKTEDRHTERRTNRKKFVTAQSEGSSSRGPGFFPLCCPGRGGISPLLDPLVVGTVDGIGDEVEAGGEGGGGRGEERRGSSSRMEKGDDDDDDDDDDDNSPCRRRNKFLISLKICRDHIKKREKIKISAKLGISVVVVDDNDVVSGINRRAKSAERDAPFFSQGPSVCPVELKKTGTASFFSYYMDGFRRDGMGFRPLFLVVTLFTSCELYGSYREKTSTTNDNASGLPSTCISRNVCIHTYKHVLGLDRPRTLSLTWSTSQAAVLLLANNQSICFGGLAPAADGAG
ncbi:hypothetical protein L249_2748, partial [Ophiocordyceps polyrhachis-furcata BCC 54312]